VSSPKLAALAVALACVIAGKTYYRHATADQLAWLLAPTAVCVSAATDTHFVRERGVGYVYLPPHCLRQCCAPGVRPACDRQAAFEIVPACAGLHFLLCALVVLVVAAAPASWPAAAKSFALACAGAYAATIVVNTVRIAIAVRMHEHAITGLHRFEGTVVYLGGLCALYSIARRLYAPSPA
jgi:exosortase/archaeosortase family protein